jgi:hypothetical protein
MQVCKLSGELFCTLFGVIRRVKYVPLTPAVAMKSSRDERWTAHFPSTARWNIRQIPCKLSRQISRKLTVCVTLRIIFAASQLCWLTRSGPTRRAHQEFYLSQLYGGCLARIYLSITALARSLSLDKGLSSVGELPPRRGSLFNMKRYCQMLCIRRRAHPC